MKSYIRALKEILIIMLPKYLKYYMKNIFTIVYFNTDEKSCNSIP